MAFLLLRPLLQPLIRDMAMSTILGMKLREQPEVHTVYQ
jgi:hypothetical protein